VWLTHSSCAHGHAHVQAGKPRAGAPARAFTIVELLVVVSIIALLVALLLPTIARARDKALTTQSLANLRGLAAANESYATDWQGRQYTATPDDVGLAKAFVAHGCSQRCFEDGATPHCDRGHATQSGAGLCLRE
jgi:prepilin-type N-terminal cleavage/methylation domain-containing protein